MDRSFSSQQQLDPDEKAQAVSVQPTQMICLCIFLRRYRSCLCGFGFPGYFTGWAHSRFLLVILFLSFWSCNFYWPCLRAGSE